MKKIEGKPRAPLRKADEGKYFVHNVTTGQRGWLVDKDDPDRPVVPPYDDARTMVRLDRPMQLLLKRYSAHEWQPLVQSNPLSEMAKAKVAYAALGELAYALGDHARARKSWMDLKDTQRAAFTRGGPAALDPAAADDVRQRIWSNIMELLA